MVFAVEAFMASYMEDASNTAVQDDTTPTPVATITPTTELSREDPPSPPPQPPPSPSNSEPSSNGQLRGKSELDDIMLPGIW
ncbi:hypothetical protein K402DRAFT_417226 [Aulographum hederae CBS 113979]|uniref:Uncharacterized protein n=1 Tax=Aulographum hederae CBS 113979 TaxID=1176131 RepID=A0A6G1HDS0_9PEZI|nr:hypothetical protein K402DRAFT_417226 [Aulographum hederae CBS 113979]